MYKLIIALLFAATGLQAQDSIPFPNLVRVSITTSTNPNRHLNPFDGDGVKVRFPDGRVVKARFASIDAPEIKNLSFWAGSNSTQPFAIQSRDFLTNLIKGKDILIDTIPFGRKKMSYDRMVVDAYTLDSVLISEVIVKNGCAWYSAVDAKRVNPSINERLVLAFEQAKIERIGLWGLKGRKYSPNYWKKTHRNKPKQ